MLRIEALGGHPLACQSPPCLGLGRPWPPSRHPRNSSSLLLPVVYTLKGGQIAEATSLLATGATGATGNYHGVLQKLKSQLPRLYTEGITNSGPIDGKLQGVKILVGKVSFKGIGRKVAAWKWLSSARRPRCPGLWTLGCTVRPSHWQHPGAGPGMKGRSKLKVVMPRLHRQGQGHGLCPGSCLPPPCRLNRRRM